MARIRSIQACALGLSLLLPPCARASTDRPIRSIVASPAPAPGSSDVRFIVSGDSRPTVTGAPLPRVFRTMVGEIGLIRPDFVLWAGDTIYGYKDTPAELRAEYAQFLSVFQDTRVPLFNCPGNHEIHSDEQDPCDGAPGAPEMEFEKQYGNLYGSFDYGDLHFIALDTSVRCNPDRIDGDQLAWLRKDLEANKGARMIFVFAHTEMYSSQLIDDPQKGSHPPIANRDELHALFSRYPVRAVFSGHEHLFWHEEHDTIQYFVSGGAGAPLYAPPDKQGFSHYLIVTVSGATVAYDVIEPGRLFQEDVAAGGRRGGSIWIVNSNDSDILVRGARIRVPAPAGSCAQIAPEAHVTNWDRTTTPVDVKSTSCAPRGGALEITLSLKVPKGKSVAVSVGKPNPSSTRPRR